MRSIETLVSEHDNILRLIKVIREAQLKIMRGEEPSPADFRKFIAFIRLYADQTHHGKEEQFLFKEMTDELGAMGDNLVRHGMLVEHDLARLYVRSLEQAVDEYEAEKSLDKKLDLLIYSGAYADLLSRHISKENAVVFTFGERQLSPEAKARVEAATEAFETDEENRKVRETQLSILDELEKAYL